MARQLRVQFPGALYHIINRGNYRHDVFVAQGAIGAFDRTLGQTCTRYAWRIHAYVIMRNHFHLALETPHPNLADGMQWLQATFASRFNRFRAESGHVFQGRYKALLIEDSAALFRVVNYIHLNPVRARISSPEEIGEHAASSLHRCLHGHKAEWLIAGRFLSQLGLDDSRSAWRRYKRYLIALATDRAEQERQGFATLSRGWAIGTAGWKRALARKLSSLKIDQGLQAAEVRAMKAARWQDAFDEALGQHGKSTRDIVAEPQIAPWKLTLAADLRRQVAASYHWLATALKVRSPLALRVGVFRLCNK